MSVLLQLTPPDLSPGDLDGQGGWVVAGAASLVLVDRSSVRYVVGSDTPSVQSRNVHAVSVPSDNSDLTLTFNFGISPDPDFGEANCEMDLLLYSGLELGGPASMVLGFSWDNNQMKVALNDDYSDNFIPVAFLSGAGRVEITNSGADLELFVDDVSVFTYHTDSPKPLSEISYFDMLMTHSLGPNTWDVNNLALTAYNASAGTITTTGAAITAGATASGTFTIDDLYSGSITLTDNISGSTFGNAAIVNDSQGTYTITPTVAGTHTLSGASAPTLTLTPGTLVVQPNELAARFFPAGNLAGNDNWTADGHGMAVVDNGGDICVTNQTVEDSAETNYTPLPGTLTSGLTLEFDMKVVFQNGQSVNQEFTVFSAADEAVLYCLITLNDNGATDCYMAASNTLIHFTSSPTFTDGVYKHFKLTYNDGIAFAYVDGVRVASVVKTRNVGAATKFQLVFTPASATSINRVFVKHITVDAGPFPPTAGTITTTGTVAINATATGTVTLDGDYLGTVTLSDNKTGSTFAHGTLNFLSAANHSVGTFTITPTVAGAHTISGASSPTLTITSGALVVSNAPTPGTSSRSNGCIDGIILRIV